ncbi:mucin-like glycoprotein [Trypanosoma conorhini]|uniref:Mucin-like glycoprotein n=1 Tax=Trypanosoma conorhini TaxID=83891 RepID=A0A422P2T8_9TRYP|nr:mucin-like glycoprotein [Trypanosoma conorhini]RNF12040.1 mucin-like glycoprotein [Trypanosoma conorhini]
MTLTVRRRAVCALALLALLCGCCAPSVCGATGARVAATTAKHTSPPAVLRKEWQPVNVSVEVSCADSGNKLSWRFSSTAAWEKCAAAVGGLDYTIVGEDPVAEVEDVVTVGIVSVDVSQYGAGDGGVSESLCLSAESLYATANCKASCGSDKSARTAFTMNFPTHVGSGVHKKWAAANTPTSGSPSLPAADGGALGKPGVCPLTIPAREPAAKGASRGEKGTDAGEQPPGPSAAPPAGTAESGTRGSGETGTSPTPQRPSGTPNSATPPTGGSEGSTTTTTSSPSAAKHTKSNTDSTVVNALLVRAPLLLLSLLLTAALD